MRTIQDDCDIKIQEKILKSVTSIKYLGVCMDEKLNFNEQISTETYTESVNQTGSIEKIKNKSDYFGVEKYRQINDLTIILLL